MKGQAIMFRHIWALCALVGEIYDIVSNTVKLTARRELSLSSTGFWRKYSYNEEKQKAVHNAGSLLFLNIQKRKRYFAVL